MAGLLCAIHQPNFLPRLSTLAKLYAADIWVILDDVQFTRRDYQHRCYLTPVADAQLPGRWLTIPVHLPGSRATLIKDALLAEPALTAKRTSAIARTRRHDVRPAGARRQSFPRECTSRISPGRSGRGRTRTALCCYARTCAAVQRRGHVGRGRVSVSKQPGSAR
jgi:WbqC-like protein family